MLASGYSEVQGSPRINYNKGGAHTATREWVGPLCNLPAFLADSFGSWNFIGAAPGPYTWEWTGGHFFPAVWAAGCNQVLVTTYDNVAPYNKSHAVPVAFRVEPLGKQVTPPVPEPETPVPGTPYHTQSWIPAYTIYKESGLSTGDCGVDTNCRVEVDFENLVCDNINGYNFPAAADDDAEDVCAAGNGEGEFVPQASNITIQSGTCVEIQFSPTVEAFAQPGRHFKLVQELGHETFPGGTIPAIGDVVSLAEDAIEHSILPVMNCTITWRRVPGVRWDIINSHIGKVNRWPFLGYPREAVLFLGYEPEPYYWWDGSKIYDIKYQFVIRDAPTNKFEAYLYTTTEPSGPFCPGVVSGYIVFRGRVGRWNRTWSRFVVELDGGAFRQHWRRIAWIDQDDNAKSFQYKEFDFKELFDTYVSPVV